MRALLLLAFTLAAVLSFCFAADDVCRFFSDGTKIRDPDSCNHYITCNNFKSQQSKCEGTTPFFDKATSKCVKSLNDDSSCYVSCANASNRFLPDPKSCYGYYYCFDEDTIGYGECPGEMHFVVEEQACVYKKISECKTHQFEFCAIVADGVNFNDIRHCANYFVCTKGVLTGKSCKSDQYYQPATGACAPKAQVNCEAHPVPAKTCGTASSPKKNKFVKDTVTCSGYFFCALKEKGNDTAPVWNQCPDDLFFDEKKQSCVDPLSIICTTDRCDGRTLTFVNYGNKNNDNGCREYLRCKDGYTVEKLSCNNFFFDERKGACVSNVISYEACKKKVKNDDDDDSEEDD